MPIGWKDNPALARWCATQRVTHNWPSGKRGTLSSERIKLLENLGFEWHPNASAWEKMVSALTAYKQVHGDSNVPQEWKDNPRLAKWCSHQRTLYKNYKLSPNRVKRLEQLAIVWDKYEIAWEEMFAALSDYRQKHGDCNVPQRWKDNPDLGVWCATQRRVYKNNELSPERVERLEKLGFV